MLAPLPWDWQGELISTECLRWALWHVSAWALDKERSKWRRHVRAQGSNEWHLSSYPIPVSQDGGKCWGQLSFCFHQLMMFFIERDISFDAGSQGLPTTHTLRTCPFPQNPQPTNFGHWRRTSIPTLQSWLPHISFSKHQPGSVPPFITNIDNKIPQASTYHDSWLTSRNPGWYSRPCGRLGAC